MNIDDLQQELVHGERQAIESGAAETILRQQVAVLGQQLEDAQKSLNEAVRKTQRIEQHNMVTRNARSQRPDTDKLTVCRI